jgi:hypothetical protein
VSLDPSAWQRFVTDDQDPQAVAAAWAAITPLLLTGEEVIYIAVQRKPGVTLNPASVVLTTKRVLIHQPGVLGRAAFEDHPWRDFADIRIQEGMLGTELQMLRRGGERLVVESLPKAQAQRIQQYVREREGAAQEPAQAGPVSTGPAARSAPAPDPQQVQTAPPPDRYPRPITVAATPPEPPLPVPRGRNPLVLIAGGVLGVVLLCAVFSVFLNGPSTKRAIPTAISVAQARGGAVPTATSGQRSRAAGNETPTSAPSPHPTDSPVPPDPPTPVPRVRPRSPCSDSRTRRHWMIG